MKAIVVSNDGVIMRVLCENGRGYKMDGKSTGEGKEFEAGEEIHLEIYRNAIAVARLEEDLVHAKVIIDQGIANTKICLRCGGNLGGSILGYCADCEFFYFLEKQ